MAVGAIQAVAAAKMGIIFETQFSRIPFGASIPGILYARNAAGPGYAYSLNI